MIFRSLIACFSAAVLALLGGCNKSDLYLDVAWSGIALSYPFAATVVPTPSGGGKLVAVNIATGQVQTLWDDTLAYNSVSGVPNSGGQFLATAIRRNGSTVFAYDAARHRASIVFERNEKLRSPFLMGTSACALAPQDSTQKQALDFTVVCADGGTLEQFSIPSYGSRAFGDDTAIFLGQGKSPTIYKLSLEGGEVAASTLLAGDVDRLRVAGVLDGVPILYSQQRSGVTAYRLEDGRLSIDDSLSAALAHANEGGARKFLLERRDSFLTSRRQKQGDAVQAEFWSGGTKTASFTIPIR